MTTQAVSTARHRSSVTPVAVQWAWLAGGLLLAFLVPFVFTDVLELQRDLYYGLYGAAVVAYLAAWARATDQPLRRLARRRLPAALVLAAAASGILVMVVYRGEDATERPTGLEFAAALAWRGVFYGVVDGLLLSVFPILAVFAAFRGGRLARRRGGTALVAAVALAASLAMTAVYHAGYSDFRGEKLRKPLTGDVVWSAPTLLTLNPVGSPAAHVALHVAAVTHSYDTDTFLPPHD
jgi:hypothetical protein